MPRYRLALVLACLLCASWASSSTIAQTPGPPASPPDAGLTPLQWPAPNADVLNTRVARASISSQNVSQLGVAWTLPLQGEGVVGFHVSNPVIDHGVVYVQDGASNVIAVSLESGQPLWTQLYGSTAFGPNGVTVANGRIYGVTANGVFALDAQSGTQVWYASDFGVPDIKFNIPPQVADGTVFVSSSLTAGGGVIYAIDATTGATQWSFQTVIDPMGQQLAGSAGGAGGAWDAMLIGPDHSVYAGIGNPYLSLEQAVQTPSGELYTDSLVKLDRATGQLLWYFQAFPDDFHDWDLQISPILTSTAAGEPLVLAAGKGGFVYAVDPGSGTLRWKTAVGVHNGHDDDDERALAGTLQLQAPYTLLPGTVGGVLANMAAADGVVYVPVNNAPTTFPDASSAFIPADLEQASGELVALDLASGRQLWATPLPDLALGGATVVNDLVFTSTYDGEVFALQRATGSMVWRAQLPAGSNSPLAIVGDTVIAGAGVADDESQQPAVVAYRLGSGTPATLGP